MTFSDLAKFQQHRATHLFCDSWDFCWN